MKFLCDEMLKGVARWLRAAGYDTLIAPDGTPDRKLIEQARQQQRVFLTRDRRLVAEQSPADDLVLLTCNGQNSCLEELRRRLGVDWLRQPFSRCLRCNTLLIEADPERWREVPEQSRELATRLLYCPSCNQLFWDGGHVARMRARLQQANAAAIAPHRHSSN